MNNTNYRTICCSLILALLLPTSTYAASQPGTTTYTVAQGDSLYKIAKTYQTSVQELIAVNHLATDKLQIGQVLQLPANSGMNPNALQQMPNQPVKLPVTASSVKQEVTTSSVGQPSDLPELDQASQAKQASVSVPSLNVRAMPSTSSEIVGKLTWGILIDVVEVDTEWSKITYNGQEAYVATPYITYPAIQFTATDADSSTLQSIVQPLLNTRYVSGGSTPDGFDCSGFTLYVFQQLGIALPRTSEEQFTIGQEVSLDQLLPGDLLFYDSLNKGKISHVAMYMGDGMIVHANGSEVRYEKVANMHKLYPYYGAKRYLAKGEQQ